MGGGSSSHAIEAFTRHQEFRRFSPATTKRRRASLTSLARFIAPLTLLSPEVTTELLEDWLNQFAAARTRRAYASDARTFFAWARKRTLVDHDPAAELDSIRVPKTEPRPLDPALVVHAIETAPTWRIMAAIALGAFAGLRRSEVAALRVDDIRMFTRPPSIVVRQGKGAKDRVVPIVPLLADVLALGAPTTGRLLGVSSQVIAHDTCRHLAHLGCNATFHQLRHTFGTEAARVLGGNVVLVGKLMGHTTADTTLGYIGLNGGDWGALGAMYRAS